MSLKKRKTLKELANCCSQTQRDFLIRIYSNGKYEMNETLDDICDNISVKDLKHAIDLCERTIVKNEKNIKLTRKIKLEQISKSKYE